MAGTIPNLPLSTQFDKDTGFPLRGGKLYFFQAGTIATPQSAYRETGLTSAHPNPITLDGSGRIPSFYLADGSIHIRLTNAQGVTQFEELSLLVVGPSSGEGGGATVDATAIFQTGDVIWLDQSGARSGWVRDNGRTVGSATSGAAERANADVQSLHAFLWNTYSDAICPVNGGRGASAAADWSANKWITLPDKRGYVPGGLDDMGNSAASRYTGVPVISGSVTAAGSVVGETSHALTSGENGPHTHTAESTDSGHTHPDNVPAPGQTSGGGLGNAGLVTATATSGSGTANITTTIASSGSGTAHNTVQRTVLGTFYRKL